MTIKSVTQLGGSSKLQVVFESGEKYKISAVLAAQFGLCSGKELSEAQMDALLAEIRKEQTRERAVRMISLSALSERLLKERLIQKGADAQDAEGTVEWLHELHLTDDLQTATELVAAAARKGYGKKRIESILYEKKIPKELWQQAMEALPAPDDAIDRFVRQKLGGKELDEKLIRKTIDALLRRGHSYHDISAAIRRFQEDIELEETGMEELP